MSKKVQKMKTAVVRKQISDLKLRVAKLESCLCTLQEDPDHTFKIKIQILVSTETGKNKLNQKRMRKITLPVKRKKKTVMQLP